MGTVVHRHFRSLNDCWHLSFHVTAIFFLPTFFTRCLFMQGSSYLCKLRDEPVIVSHEPKKTLDLGDGGGGRPFSNSIHFACIGCYSLGGDNVPQVCYLPVE